MVEQKIESDAFRIEYSKNILDQVVFDDVISYLGEYRFNLAKYSYSFKFKDGKLRDPNRNDSMQELSQRAINTKSKEGKSSVRERAELKGFQSLDEQLRYAKTDSTIIWVSPPGPKNEGYGDYGFVYFGKVESNNLEEKNIKMTAIRVEKPNIEQFNRALRMLGGKKEYARAEEFLANPDIFAEDLKEGYVDAILKMVFNFKPNEKEQEKFRQIINKMFHLIYYFSKNPRRSRQDLYALENYALELKRDYESKKDNKGLCHPEFISGSRSRNKFGMTDEQVQHGSFYVNPGLKDIVGEYGHKPPVVAGSCGSTGSSNGIKSSNIFNSLSPLNSLLSEDKYGSRIFECPSCGKTNIRPKDQLTSQCQHCGSKDVAC
ncbi:MAG: hypothetical protein AAB600_04580 [Patescibacteria group bacterium]